MAEREGVFEQYLPIRAEEAGAAESLDEFWSNYWHAGPQERADEKLGESDYAPLIDEHIAGRRRILEGGCGLGEWMFYLRQRGATVYGVDISRLALSRLKKLDGSLALSTGDILSLPFPDDFFDAYLSLGVIEHLQGRMEEALAEIHRVLRHDGTLLVSVPYQNPLKKWILTRYPGRRRGGEQAYQFYQYVLSREAFLSMIESNGFRIAAVALVGESIGLEHRVPRLLRLERAERQTRMAATGKKSLSPLSILRRVYKGILRSLPKSWNGHMIAVVCHPEKDGMGRASEA